MTFKSLSIALALSIGFGATAASAEDTSPSTDSATGFSVNNLIDPAKWHDDAGNVEPGITVAFNPFDPKSWMNFVNPKMHTKMHMAFTNPAQYGQFFNPSFHVAMMNPVTWMTWMNPQSYAVLMDPKTYAYWMQPGAYQHAIELTHYKQMINMDAYAKLGEDAKAGAEELVAEDGKYSITNTDNLVRMLNPMTYASAMIDGAKKIIE